MVDIFGNIVVFSEAMETFLTMKEAAAVLKVSTRTVRSYIKCGRIRAAKLGKGRRGAIRIPVSELERLSRIGFEENIERLRQEFEDDRL